MIYTFDNVRRSCGRYDPKLVCTAVVWPFGITSDSLKFITNVMGKWHEEQLWIGKQIALLSECTFASM